MDQRHRPAPADPTARRFSIPTISRSDLMSLTEECAKVTGIPYVMDAYREEAMAIINS